MKDAETKPTHLLFLASPNHLLSSSCAERTINMSEDMSVTIRWQTKDELTVTVVPQSRHSSCGRVDAIYRPTHNLLQHHIGR